MPGLGGQELAARPQPQRPEKKVLYMSGFTLVRSQREILETEASLEPDSPILAKPFSVEGLTQKVREVLGTPRSSRSPFARARRTRQTICESKHGRLSGVSTAMPRQTGGSERTPLGARTASPRGGPSGPPFPFLTCPVKRRAPH